MLRKVLTVSCGQARVQLGDAEWRPYCAEHSVIADGKTPNTSRNGSFCCFIEQTNGGLFVPRNFIICNS